jgi:hypothetical protein
MGGLVLVRGNSRRGRTGRGCRRMNMVQKCVHVYVNAKMISVKTISGMGG